MGPSGMADPISSSTAPPSSRRRLFSKLPLLSYPRSFFALLIMGFMLICSPLVISLARSVVYADQLALQSEQAVRKAAQASEEGRVLSETLTAMERSVRQFQVLGDTALLKNYAALHEQFGETAKTLSTLANEPHLLETVQQLMSKEVALNAMLVESNFKMTSFEEFDMLTLLGNQVTLGANRLIDREVDGLLAAANKSQRKSLLFAAVSIPLALLLAAILAYAIAKPVRQIDQAINRLGNAELDTPIKVGGPEDLRLLGERLDWLRRRLATLEAQRAKLLANVSHDLKTPLASIHQGVELLNDEVLGPLQPSQKEVVQIMAHSAEDLKARIGDLLSMDEGILRDTPLNLGPVDLGKLTRAVIDRHRLHARGRGVHFKMNLLPVVVHGDTEKLRVIIDNLVSNAVKFSPERGEIEMSLHLDQGEACLDVQDEGPGIAQMEREKIFDARFKGTLQVEAAVAGSGLGLAIAREFALAHGGTVKLLDRPPRKTMAGRGSHFQLRLPGATLTDHT